MTQKIKNNSLAEQVFLMLGSNIEPRRDYLSAAFNAITAWPECHEVHYVSPIRETAPYGEFNQSSFLNQLLVVSIALLPLELLRRIKQIERIIGRRESYRWGPREIDIDILFYGSWAVDLPELQIPHVDYCNRSFVRDLLCEYDPNFCDPYSGKSVGK